jgi:hypothetical protein
MVVKVVKRECNLNFVCSFWRFKNSLIFSLHNHALKNRTVFKMNPSGSGTLCLVLG